MPAASFPRGDLAAVSVASCAWRWDLACPSSRASGLSARFRRKEPSETRVPQVYPRFVRLYRETRTRRCRQPEKRPHSPHGRFGALQTAPPHPQASTWYPWAPTPPAEFCRNRPHYPAPLSLPRGRSPTPRFGTPKLRAVAALGVQIPVPHPSLRPLRRPVSPHHPPNLATRARVGVNPHQAPLTRLLGPRGRCGGTDNSANQPILSKIPDWRWSVCLNWRCGQSELEMSVCLNLGSSFRNELELWSPTAPTNERWALP